MVFTPQIMLWKVNKPETSIDVPNERAEIDKKLKQLGFSITGLEVFCIRRSIDYLSTLNYVNENRIGMMGISYGGYFLLHTAAADPPNQINLCCSFFQ